MFLWCSRKCESNGAGKYLLARCLVDTWHVHSCSPARGFCCAVLCWCAQLLLGERNVGSAGMSAGATVTQHISHHPGKDLLCHWTGDKCWWAWQGGTWSSPNAMRDPFEEHMSGTCLIHCLWTVCHCLVVRELCCCTGCGKLVLLVPGGGI